MHSPSMLTTVVALQMIQDQAVNASAHRAISRGGRIRARRRGAFRILVPRGRIAPPFAH